jgi:hypothetical protein
MTLLRASLSLGLLWSALACSGTSDDSGGSGGSPNAGRGGSTGGSSAGGSGGSGGTSGGSGGTAGASTGGSAGSGGSAVTGGSGGASGGTTGGTGGGKAGAGGASGGSTGGTGGGKAGAGSGGVAGSEACCLAFPTCGPGEREVQSEADCALIPMCHAVSLCCSTIYCAVLTPGSGGSSGAAGSGGKGGGSAECDPESEHDRDYIGESPAECAVILYACPDHTTAFGNECGCGCEQEESCPEFVDCMPGGNPNPGCSTEERERCPYTDVAF